MLRRPPTAKTPALEAPSAPEFVLVDVTRLQVALDVGPPLFFDLAKTDSFISEYGDGTEMLVTVGARVVRIKHSRILYYETFPWKKQHFAHPMTVEQLAALTKQ